MGRQPAIRLLTEEVVDLVFRNAAIVLERRGVRLIDDAGSCALLADAGVVVDGDTVRGPLDRLLEIGSTAPASFVQHARDPVRSVTIGGDAAAVTIPVYGPPHVLGDDGVRRLGTADDYERLLRLADAAPGITNTGHMLCVPDDVPADGRDDWMISAHLRVSGKPLMGSTSGEASALAAIARTDMAFGGGAGRDCRLLFLCNSIPPLTFTDRMLGVLRAAATNGQAALVTSFQMLGATGPASALGSLTQGLAEVAVGIALTQLHRSGAPVVLGTYGVPFDMRTMGPRFGSDPVSHQIQSGAVQVARRLGIPALGYGGMTSSKVDDAQSGSESAAATAIARDAGADVIIHAAGWLDHGRTTGLAKFRREAEALRPFTRSGGTGARSR